MLYSEKLKKGPSYVKHFFVGIRLLFLICNLEAQVCSLSGLLGRMFSHWHFARACRTFSGLKLQKPYSNSNSSSKWHIIKNIDREYGAGPNPNPKPPMREHRGDA